MTQSAWLIVASGAGIACLVLSAVVLWSASRHATAKWCDLITDPDTGRMSYTKVWANIAMGAMTAGFVSIIWQATPSDGVAWLFFTYGGLATGSPIANRLLTMRFGAGQQQPGTETTSVKTETTKTVAASPAPAATPAATP